MAGSKKYDWNKLKRQFITGRWKSLKDFATHKGIDYDVVKQNAKGWIDAKRNKSERVNEGVINAAIEREIDRNTRHLKVWDEFLRFGECFTLDKLAALAASRDHGIDAILKLSKVLERVQKGQRLAEGLDLPKDTTREQEDKLAELFDKIDEDMTGE